MDFWQKDLLELHKSEKTFQAIFNILYKRHKTEIFGRYYDNHKQSEMTYNELYHRIFQISNGITLKYGHLSGGYIAINMVNSTDWVSLFWAVLSAGFKPVLIQSNLELETFNSIVKRLSPICMFVDNTQKASIETLTIQDLNLNNSDWPKTVWANEVALTSTGTTSNPKIVIYDGEGISEQILTSEEIFLENKYIAHNKNYEIVILALIPFYHVFGFIVNLLWFFFFGRTFVFLENLDPNTIKQTAIDFKISHLFGIPLLFNQIVDKILLEVEKENKTKKFNRAIKLSIFLQRKMPVFGRWLVHNVIFRNTRKRILGTNLKYMISGGSYIKKETCMIMNGLGYALHNGYGLTEMGILSVENSKKIDDRLTSSIGPFFSSVETVIDQDILKVKSKTASKTIYHNDSVLSPKDGWFLTKDIIRLDKKGKYHILGRVDDMVILPNGENINPDMIETEINLNGHNYSVLGLENEDGNHVLTLIVQVPEDMDKDNLNKLRDKIKLNNSLVNLHAQITKFYFTYESLPMKNGKIQRKELKKMWYARAIKLFEFDRNEHAFVEEDEMFLQILNDVKDCFSKSLDIVIDKIGNNDHFISDLGGNSLEYYGLLNLVSNRFSFDFLVNENSFEYTPFMLSRVVYNKKESSRERI